MKINTIYKKQTDEDTYKNIKKLYKQHPHIFMNPEMWKRLRLVELKKEGKIWSE